MQKLIQKTLANASVTALSKQVLIRPLKHFYVHAQAPLEVCTLGAGASAGDGRQGGLGSLVNAFLRVKSLHKQAFKAREGWKRQSVLAGQEKGISSKEVKGRGQKF